jgi:predicted metal-binding membrane protein
VLLCWAWIVPMAQDMYGAMDGASAWMMRGAHGPAYLLLLLAMWQVMMAGMMLPSAAPTLLLYAQVARRAEPAAAAAQVHAFAAGYLLAWGGFSLAATALQLLLAQALLLSPMLQLRGPAAAALLLLAGAWQLSGFKQGCLQSCRAPAAFIAGHWRAGRGGALRMGLEHGFHCLGCCWALMLLLFAGGVMNLWWIAALTGFVLLEKLAPPRAAPWIVRLGAALLLLGGVALLLRAPAA